MLDKKKTEKDKQRARALVAQMTLEEKVHQLLHTAPAIPRLGIPAYNYWNEALHGVARAGTATVFPQAIGLAATFDENLIEKVAEVISTEGRGKFDAHQKYDDTGIFKGLTFWAPNVNIFRDPRWGRGHETFGEDPYLTSRLGVRFVEGIQGDDPVFLKAAACAKHFAVHSGPESLRHSFDAVVSEQDLRETYLPAFRALVTEAGVEAVMGAYNRTNGEACCGSPRLLQSILRAEWAFDGHVTSDCWAIRDLHEHHHVTATIEESVALAMNSGCDLNCGNIYGYLVQAVQAGLVQESRIDEAVTRVLTTRFKLGLFDPSEPNPYAKYTFADVDTTENRAFNRAVAAQTLTLLKNENGLLPLDLNSLRTIGVIGPNADSRAALVGNYEGTASEYVTVLEGIRAQAEQAGVRVLYSEGCHLYKDRMSCLADIDDRLAEMRAVCENSDVIVACLGLDGTLEGEEGDTGNEYGSGDKPNLKLPGLQQHLLQEAASSGKPVVLVLLTGSAMDITWADENLPAVLQGWYPGAQGGHAVADVLFGGTAPQGKLPVTFYRSEHDLPDFCDYAMKGRTYRYMKVPALYPFGYGLTYTDFSFENLTADAADLAPDRVLHCQLTARNVGRRAGTETLEVYLQYIGADAPNWQLKSVQKISLAAGECRKVAFTLCPRDFALFDSAGRLQLNAGTYRIYAGASQPDERSAALLGHRPCRLELTVAETTPMEE